MIENHDLTSLRALFLAGERSDPDTLHWVETKLSTTVVDHWWQTESGWPITGNPLGLESFPIRYGSVTVPMVGWNVAVQRDIDRIASIWTDLRTRYASEGPFLFGSFTIADAFYAPIVSRFATYGVHLPESAKAYADFVLALPAMQDWAAAAREERDFVPADEPYRTEPDRPDAIIVSG